jgi:hypothetical protein
VSIRFAVGFWGLFYFFEREMKLVHTFADSELFAVNFDSWVRGPPLLFPANVGFCGSRICHIFADGDQVDLDRLKPIEILTAQNTKIATGEKVQFISTFCPNYLLTFQKKKKNKCAISNNFSCFKSKCILVKY